MAERENRVSLPALAGDGLLLGCALLGLAGSFLTLYGSGEVTWMDTAAPQAQPTPLDLCAARLDSFLLLAALLALAALAVWALPRFRGAAAGGLAALLGLLAWSNWESVVCGAGLTVHAVTAIFAQRVSWGWVFSYDPALTPSEGGAAVRLFLSLALALLALALGWAVERARRWWAVLLLTLPPLLPGLLADLYPDWPPFMALAACWCAMLLTDLCKWAAPTGRGKLTLAALPCVAALLAAITLAFPREGYTRPAWALEWEAGLYHQAGRLADLLSRFDGPFGGRVTYVGSAEEADLSRAGPLNYTGRTVLRVDSDYSGRLYLRGSSLSAYENGRWTAMPEEAYEEYSSSPHMRTFPLFYPALMAENGPAHTVTVDNVGAVGACVYAPYFLPVQDLEEGGMLPMQDAFLARRQGQWTHTLSFVELEPPAASGGGTVHVEMGAGGPAAGGRADFASYDAFVRSRYLDVPEEVRAAFDELFSPTSGHSPAYVYVNTRDPVEAAENIAFLLNGMCEYDPETPAAPEGVDPVLYFLTGSRRGYCMHYASAAALLLRSLGIPARYVSGFTAQCAPGRQAAVPDRAAHAWVEVWVDGFGWYPVEVTPAAAFEWYGQGTADPADMPSEPLPESGEPEPTPAPSQAPDASPPPGAAPADSGGPADGPGSAALFGALRALAAAAGAAALVWLAQYLPKRFRAKKLSGPDRNRAALDGYGYLRRMERWGGRVDGRAVELAQKARFSQHILTREELDEVRGLVDRERARLCVVLGPAARLAFRYFWGSPPPPKKRKKPENSHENGG